MLASLNLASQANRVCTSELSTSKTALHACLDTTVPVQVALLLPFRVLKATTVHHRTLQVRQRALSVLIQSHQPKALSSSPKLATTLLSVTTERSHATSAPIPTSRANRVAKAVLPAHSVIHPERAFQALKSRARQVSIAFLTMQLSRFANKHCYRLPRDPTLSTPASVTLNKRSSNAPREHTPVRGLVVLLQLERSKKKNACLVQLVKLVPKTACKLILLICLFAKLVTFVP